MAQYARHVNPAFVKLLGIFGYGRVFARAKDVWIWDTEGRRYLDLLAGYGAVNLGHNHPRLLERLTRFLGEDTLGFCHIGPPAPAAALAAALAERAGEALSACVFSTGGGEAVEAGLKLARLATGRPGFLYCEGGFHGTSLGTLSIMGHERMRAPLEPLLADCAALPFGDLGALESALRPKRTAAFVVEPILGEGGVVMPPPGYLREAQALCRRYGTLLVLDEVQTGLGRTGTRFAFEGEGFVPDVLVLAKALSGGLVPVAVTLTHPELHKAAFGTSSRFDLHNATFAGNALSCVAALETLSILDDERLAENAAIRGRQLVDGLRARLEGHPLVREIRGRGLLVGLALGPPDGRRRPFGRAVAKHVLGQWVSLKLLEAGFVCQPASQAWDVLKIEPPLTIGAVEIEAAADAIAEVLGPRRNSAKVLLEAGRRVGEQFRRKWAFR